jgi:hypothetical protein
VLVKNQFQVGLDLGSFVAAEELSAPRSWEELERKEFLPWCKKVLLSFALRHVAGCGALHQSTPQPVLVTPYGFDRIMLRGVNMEMGLSNETSIQDTPD